jgi:hypothetical protein
MQVENRTEHAATILNGAALSNAINLRGEVLVAVRMPAAWTAAGITFQVSMDNVTYLNAYAAGGGEVALVVVAAHHVWLDPAAYMGFRWIKVRSGTGGTPVNQLAERVFSVISRGIG